MKLNLLISLTHLLQIQWWMAKDTETEAYITEEHDDDGVKSLTVDDHPGTFDILETDLVVRKKLDYYLVIPKGDCT